MSKFKKLHERSEESFLRPFTSFRVTGSVYLLCIITKNDIFAKKKKKKKKISINFINIPQKRRFFIFQFIIKKYFNTYFKTYFLKRNLSVKYDKTS